MSEPDVICVSIGCDSDVDRDLPNRVAMSRRGPQALKSRNGHDQVVILCVLES